MIMLLVSKFDDDDDDDDDDSLYAQLAMNIRACQTKLQKDVFLLYSTLYTLEN